MITNLKKFRENMYDTFTYEEKDGKLYFCNGYDRKLYKECKIEELPKRFIEIIKEHENAEYRGMGAGLVYGDFFFSNVSGVSSHHCFKNIENPRFNIKLKNLSFQYVKKFIEENNLEIRCPLRKHQFKEDFVSGKLYVNLNYQEYFEKENSTGIEEIDEFFFWRGKSYKTLALEFRYHYNKQYNDSIDTKETKEKIKNEIISLFKKGEREIFSNEWKVL